MRIGDRKGSDLSLPPTEDRANDPRAGAPPAETARNDAAAAHGLPESLPGISLPKGGGAIRSIDESFQVNPVNGSNSAAIPLPVSRARQGFSPELVLTYTTGAGKSEFGLGWGLSLPAIHRSTQKAIPQYRDSTGSDDFMLEGGEALVPELLEQSGQWVEKVRPIGDYDVQRFLPRIEGSWTRIERWKHRDSGDVHWRTISGKNVATVYGPDDASRLFDPADETRIFKWLASHSYDDRGNLIVYRYKKEDRAAIPALVYEKNKSPGSCTNIYLKRVFYGNKAPYRGGDSLPADDGFMFQTVFDYGEHDSLTPTPGEDRPWALRDDPFSINTAGFEIRTYRQCQRVLLFHRFDELPVSPYLVSATELTYGSHPGETPNENDVPGFSYLKKLQHRGYLFDEQTGSYSETAAVPVSYAYQGHVWSKEIRRVDAESLLHATEGLAPERYRWIDLFGEGVSGILAERNGDWYYKSNEGDGRFSEGRRIDNKPSYAGVHSGALRLQSLTQSGRPHLIDYSEGAAGFYRLDADENWSEFIPFDSFPTGRMLDEPNARLIDLSGDGLPDLLITEDSLFRWYKSVGEDGYEERGVLPAALDEESGPRVVFADLEQAIVFADVTGDGLTDIIRIRNGDVSYWANQGYGRFSRRVTMADAPLFDSDDLFNPLFLRVADVDGSGLVDLIYLARHEILVWFNLSGNAWSQTARSIPFPAIHRQSNVDVIDLLGTGTACLVWSSSLEGDREAPLRYIDLMASTKPHLLASCDNGSGRTVSYEYLPSTHFYLADKSAGKPWVTKLPFPVQVVSKTIVRDAIRDTVFTSSYSYHHGYYDVKEREFRGFGRVEQLDTEDYKTFSRNEGSNVVEEEHHQPPIRTVTWFHTGAPDSLLDTESSYSSEYYDNPVIQEHRLDGVSISGADTADAWLESYRALRGAPLRVEIYGTDDSPEADTPFTVTSTRFDVTRVQPAGGNRFSVVRAFDQETLIYHYDRNAADPRITHSLVLERDDKGIPTCSANVTYGRLARPAGLPDATWERQRDSHVAVTESLLTADVDDDTAYRFRTAYDTQRFQYLGVPAPAGGLYTSDEILNHRAAAADLPYEQEADGTPQIRKHAHSRLYFLSDDLTTPLPLGSRESRGVGYRGQQMAFTPGLVSSRYGGRVTDQMLTDAGYEHSEGDSNWWVPGPTMTYAADAASRFYLPNGVRDPFGRQTTVGYDAYEYGVVSIENALGMRTTADMDYRTLSHWRATDANGNRVAVGFDELGMVVKSAVMGKEGAGEGDTLADPTQRLEYGLFEWRDHQRPNFVRSLTREEHGAANPRWQEAYQYFDGSGISIMAKSQVGPGPAKRWNDATNALEEVDTAERWVGNGRTVLNNKGLPIKSYEPYFSTTGAFESESALVEIGFTAVQRYDALDRPIRTDFPNGTFSSMQYENWSLSRYDANDNVLDSDWYAELGGPDPTTDPEPSDPQTRAAWLAAKHANTPVTVDLDALGRTVTTTADWGGGKTTQTRNEIDPLGRHDRIFDQLDREVSYGARDMLGEVVHTDSAESGTRRRFTDVIGRLVLQWDDRGRDITVAYDALHRPVSTAVEQGAERWVISYIVYGDLLPDAADQNMIGATYRVYDQAGVTTTAQISFKGQVERIERRLARSHSGMVDWSVLEGLNTVAAIETAAEPLLQSEVFAGTDRFDALGRSTESVLADQTVVRTTYDEGNSIRTIDAQIRGAGSFIRVLDGQDYNALGLRERITYGNGVTTRFDYDPKTWRIDRILTKKTAAAPESQGLQDLRYAFDPVGNVVECKDDAQQTHFFDNAIVEPRARFEYDAIYQLIRATGREHSGNGWNEQPTYSAVPHVSLPHPNEANAVRRYTESYEYDDVGNLLLMSHQTSSGVGQWTRHYRYAYQDDASNRTNRLVSTSQPGDPPAGPYSATYDYDVVGNMTGMPNLPTMEWNVLDQFASADLGGGGTVFYVYSGTGRRRRKIIERQGGTSEERIYLGANEILRKRNAAGDVTFERWTLHLGDGTGRVMQVDTKTIDTLNQDPANPIDTDLIRYQHGNHLGSATLETDAAGNPISYEEYHPFGTTAYHSARPGVDLSLKRYRFSGKEKDDETGLYYFGARYYAPWIGRWISTDPAGFVSGSNLYRYCSNSPVVFHDPNGTQETAPEGQRRETYRVGGVTATPTPQQMADIARSRGFDFTGFDREGNELPPNAEGRGVGLPKRIGPGRWDVGTWLRTPSSGGEEGGGAGGGEAEEPGGGGEEEEGAGGGEGEGPGAEGGAGDEEAVIDVIVTPGGGDGGDGEGAGDSSTPDGDDGTDTPADSAEEDDNDATPRADPLTHAGPAIERSIWARSFRDRGFTLEHLYSDNFADAWRAQGDNRPLYDVETDTRVKQIKSTNARPRGIRAHASKATRDAGRAISRNPTGSMSGKSPQAVIITPTDAPAGTADEIAAGFDRMRTRPANATPPEHVRGLPGTAGKIGRGLTYGGAALSALAFGYDIYNEDYSMAAGDGIATIGGALEIYAIASPGATVAGVSAMSAGLALGGVGIAVTSGISGYRAYQRGDTAGAVAGAVGVAAGIAITAGVIFSAPAVIVGGLIAAAAVGVFHLGRYFDWW